MKVCPNCKGRRLAEGKKYCRRCGSLLVSVQALRPDVIAQRQIFDIKREKDPHNTDIVEEYAGYLLSESLYEEALSLLLPMIEKAPDHETLRVRLAEVYEAKKDWANAVTQWLVLHDCNPNNVEYLSKLAELYRARSQHGHAAEMLKKWSEISPSDMEPLKRRIKLSQQGGSEETITLCKQVLEVNPNDMETLNLLAEEQLKQNRTTGASSTFESLLRLDTDNPRANLYVGLKRHNAQRFVEAVDLLKNSLAHKKHLRTGEVKLAQLYLLSSKLQSGQAKLPDLALDVEESFAQIEKKHHPVIHQCYVLLGALQLQEGNEKDAIALYQKSLLYQDSQQVRHYLSAWYREKGDQFAVSKQYKQALNAYEESLRFEPISVELNERFKTAKGMQQRRLLLWSGLALSTLVLALLLGLLKYYAQGRLAIKTIPSSKITLFSGKKVVVQDTVDLSNQASNVQTKYLRAGTYNLHVQREGYLTLKEKVHIGWGRKLKRYDLKLTPLFGALKVSSSPTNATVIVRNSLETRTCQTPCSLSKLRALPSTIRLNLPGYNPYITQQRIPVGNTLNLRTINFRGSLNIQSKPTGAIVFIQGKQEGTTPLHRKGLPAKLTKVLLMKRGIGSYLTEIQVQPGKISHINAKLTNLGSLRVHSMPSKAKVWWDETYMGQTPLVIRAVQKGRHHLRVTHIGRRSYLKTLNFQEAEVKDLGIISLKKAVEKRPPRWIKQLVERWRQAWEDTARQSSVRAFRRYYDSRFYHTNGKMNKRAYMNRLRWGARKFGWYNIRIRDLSLIQLSSRRFTVKFHQSYRRPGASDEGTKTLKWRKTGNQWRIYRERWESLGTRRSIQ